MQFMIPSRMWREFGTFYISIFNSKRPNELDWLTKVFSGALFPLDVLIGWSGVIVHPAFVSLRIAYLFYSVFPFSSCYHVT